MRVFCDTHIHNYLSNCSKDNGATVQSYIDLSAQNGLSLMGFANHTWDENVPFPENPLDGGKRQAWYQKQSMAFQMQIRSQIPEQTKGIKVLVGAETEYCGMYDRLGMGKESAMQLDFVLIPHTHVHMRDFVMPCPPDVKAARARLAGLLCERVEGMTEALAVSLAEKPTEAELEPFMTERIDYVGFVSDFMVESFRGLMNNEMLKTYSDLVPVSVAHPFAPVGSGDKRADMLARISDDTFAELFTMAAKRGIGLEIKPAALDEQVERMYRIAKACGCRFTLGSDAHSRDKLADILHAQVWLDRLSLTEYDLMDFLRR